MEKICLSEKEIEVVKKYIDNYNEGLFVNYQGEFSEILNEVIKKALALQTQLDELDSEEDLVVWYYNKYKAQ